MLAEDSKMIQSLKESAAEKSSIPFFAPVWNLMKLSTKKHDERFVWLLSDDLQMDHCQINDSE